MGFFCRAAAGGQAGVVDAAERVAVEAFAADGLLDAADDGRGRLAAELLVEDRAGERTDRVERPAPARVRVDRADTIPPLSELAVAPGQLCPRGTAPCGGRDCACRSGSRGSG